jgi:hypothetical protein
MVANTPLEFCIKYYYTKCNVLFWLLKSRGSEEALKNTITGEIEYLMITVLLFPFKTTPLNGIPYTGDTSYAVGIPRERVIKYREIRDYVVSFDFFCGNLISTNTLLELYLVTA